MAEVFNSLFKAACVRNLVLRKSGPKSISDIQIAMAKYINYWYNHRRLQGEIGHVP